MNCYGEQYTIYFTKSYSISYFVLFNELLKRRKDKAFRKFIVSMRIISEKRKGMNKYWKKVQ